MSTSYCLDEHVCHNGALCVENPDREGSFYCDCDATEGNAAYAGLSCEHEATIYCNEEGEVSLTSFCANKGKCNEFVEVDGAHQGCDCGDKYTGDFCQFVKNQNIPQGWPKATSLDSPSSNEDSTNTTAIIIASLVSVAAVLMFSIAWLIYRRRLQFPHMVDKTRDAREMDLEVNGSETMNSPSSVNTPPSAAFQNQNIEEKQVTGADVI